MYKKAIVAGTLMAVSSIGFAGGALESFERNESTVREVVIEDEADVDIVVEFEEEAEPFWEIILMGGTASLDAENTSLDITSSETDTLEQTNDGDWKSWTTQLGLGYSIPLFDATEYPEHHIEWFTAIEPQINGYFLQGNVNGNVDRFSDFPGDFNDNEYSIEVQSTRLMFDAALTIATYRNLSIYAIAGIGPSWNRINFHGKETDCVSEVNLNGHTDVNFAWEGGGGLTYTLTEDFAISVQYLYTGFTDLDLSESGDIAGVDVSEIESDDFDLSSQAVFAGFRYSF